ncbi:hypothetical protein M885DRAFT_524902 [Pelagophyceae sp. CCMP2097]|nr:hypothetical protein M885DRAFT_524902 [Pelagophyceae sp. CCMP2097]
MPDARRAVEKQRREAIRASMDKASAGMAAAHDIIDLLEKDNAIFGRYLEHDAALERERFAKEEKRLAEERKALQAQSSQSLASANGHPRRAGGFATDTDGSTFFLTGLNLVDEDEASAVRSPPRRRPRGGAENDVEDALETCARLKDAARSRLEKGAEHLRDEVHREVRDACAKMERPGPRAQLNSRNERRAATPPPELAQHSAARAAEHRRPAPLHVEEHFTARPLPQMYGSATPTPTTDVVERTIEWQRRAREKRDAERNARRLREEAELDAARQATQAVGETSALSWQKAKASAERHEKEMAAEADAREEDRRRKQLMQERRVSAAKAELEDLQKARNALRAAAAVRPRADALITRATAASKAAAHPSSLPRPVEAEAKEEAKDPFDGLEAFKFDPRVLAMIGEPDDGDDETYEPPKPTPRRQPTPRRRDEDAKAGDSRAEAKGESEYTAGTSVGFFDVLSSAERGRRRCRDARLFQPASMQRALIQDGVVLLLGTLCDAPRTDHVICALFDRSVFSEQQAYEWWCENSEERIY